MIKVTTPPGPEVAEEYRRNGWWPSAPVRQGLERVAGLDGDRVALIDNVATWTYSELREQVDRSVGALLDAGLGPEQPVLIVARNSNPSAAAILAAIRARGVAVVLDRRCGPLDVANAIESSGARLAVVPSDLREPLRFGDHGVTCVDLEALATGRVVRDWVEPDPDLARLAVFTSGTTRRAKGVLHSLSTIGAGVTNIRIAMGFEDRDRLYLATPLGTITGVLQLLVSIDGGSLVFEERFEPELAVDRVAGHRVTVLGGAPVTLELLFDECERQGRTELPLERINLGGTMIPRSVLEIAIDRFGIRPTRVYGSSEVPVHTASTEDDDLEHRLSDDGKSLPGSEYRLGAKHEGGHELEVRGPNLFLGYLVDDDNEGLFDDGWFRTGDLVEEVEGGRVRVLGRLKDVVARKGIKISLAEVEDAASSIAGVVEAAAYGVPDEEAGERVVLAVRTDAGPSDYAGVTAALTEAGLAKGKLPEEIVVWDEPLPRNPSGKVVRDAVAKGASGKLHDLAPRLANAPESRPTS